jgi:N-hydroxyarylamine O-acetyltransferase
MADLLDLDRYFARIRWDGPTAPNYATLAGLLGAHIAHIPFENIDVLLGRPVRLDLGALQAKMIHARRGGYCFEHATLFAAVLEALGFATLRHAARVIVFQPRPKVARTHMFLSVTVDGVQYVVDPGFGPFASRLPLPLDGSGVPTDRPTHRMTREGDEWVLHAPLHGPQVPAWVSTLEAENPVDFEVANHYIATHPDSLFMNWIIASAVTPDGRVNIMNREVTVVRPPSPATWQVPDRRALRALLAEHFGFDLPEVETLRVPAIPDWN